MNLLSKNFRLPSDINSSDKKINKYTIKHISVAILCGEKEGKTIIAVNKTNKIPQTMRVILFPIPVSINLPRLKLSTTEYKQIPREIAAIALIVPTVVIDTNLVA